MARTARCKFTVSSAVPSYPTAGPGELDVVIEASYDPALSEEDRAFSKATPYGFMKFGIANPALDGFFVPGRVFYVDLTPAEGQ